MKQQSKKKKIVKRVILSVLLFILLAIAALAVTFAVLYVRGGRSLRPVDVEMTAPTSDDIDVILEDDGKTVHYNGKKYLFNENIATVLIMGIDKNLDEETLGIGFNGQADALYLAIFDMKENAVSLLSISRDTMTDVIAISPSGASYDVERMQLCLAYSYGSTDEMSAQNVSLSVSHLLYGAPISAYFVVDIDAIPPLADAVGGVVVPEYDEDQMTLTGNNITLYSDNAISYVRTRNKLDVNANNARIDRQKAFINSFVKRVAEMTKSDIGTPLRLYNTVSDYIVTDFDVSEITYLSTKYLGGVSAMKMYSVPGKSERPGEYTEFNVDETALYELVLQLFYKEQ